MDIRENGISIIFIFFFNYHKTINNCPTYIVTYFMHHYNLPYHDMFQTQTIERLIICICSSKFVANNHIKKKNKHPARSRNVISPVTRKVFVSHGYPVGYCLHLTATSGPLRSAWLLHSDIIEIILVSFYPHLPCRLEELKSTTNTFFVQ